jgi:hypothetical protein
MERRCRHVYRLRRLEERGRCRDAAAVSLRPGHLERQRMVKRKGSGGRAIATGVPGGGDEGRGKPARCGRPRGHLNPLGFDRWIRRQGLACPENPRRGSVRGSSPMHVSSRRQLRTVTRQAGPQPANIRGFTVADRPLAANQDLTGSFISVPHGRMATTRDENGPGESLPGA